jgi:conjugative relaxase-like TrwC/TraI family protein
MGASIGKVSAGGIRYYSNLARDDYYTNGGEPPGEFLGSGAKILGLSGARIDHQDNRVKDLFNGIHPGNGSFLRKGATSERIYQTKDGEKVHKPVSAYDITLSAPKSVSVLWGTSNRDDQKSIESCHQTAIQECAKYIEKRLCYTRTGAQGRGREKVAPVFLAFRHSTSRELDPQLHTHLVLCNLGSRQNGQWGALDGRPILNAHHKLGDIYRSTLWYQLGQKLPLRFTYKELAKGFSFEIEGVPEALCREFSKRRQQIERELSENDTPKQVQAKVLATRKRKLGDHIPQKDLFADWRSVAKEHGFEADTFLSDKKKDREYQVKCEVYGYMASAYEAKQREFALEQYYEARDAYWERIRDDFEKARQATATRQKSMERKYCFLYATGKISRAKYLQLTEGKGIPRSKLGINLAYATHQISRKQRRYLLEKYGHKELFEPKTRFGINFAYATYRITEGQRLYLLGKYKHLKRAAPKLSPELSGRAIERDKERMNEWARRGHDQERERER